MNRIFSAVLAAVLCVSPLSLAQDAAPVVGKKAAQKKQATVPALLEKATYLTRKKPNLKARYYGFLRSASWCVPCQIFVPQLLEDYRKMKSAKLEIILLGQEDEAVVKKYMKEHKYNIPGVMPDQLGTIPGVSFEGLGFPSLCIVDADGNFVGTSGGKNMQQWREQLKAFQKEQKERQRQAKREALRDAEPEE